MQLKIFLEKLLIKEQKTEKYNQWKLTTGTKTSKQKANTLDFILELTGHLHADFSLKILKINFTCHQNKKMKQNSEKLLTSEKEIYGNRLVELFKQLLNNNFPNDLSSDVHLSFDNFLEKIWS